MSLSFAGNNEGLKDTEGRVLDYILRKIFLQLSKKVHFFLLHSTGYGSSIIVDGMSQTSSWGEGNKYTANRPSRKTPKPNKGQRVETTVCKIVAKTGFSQSLWELQLLHKKAEERSQRCPYTYILGIAHGLAREWNNRGAKWRSVCGVVRARI